MEAQIRNHTLVDARGCAISGASAGAIDAYEQALAASQSWRSGADVQVASALQQSPGFVMAHVLQAYLLLCSRDRQRVRSALPVHARAAALPANERERMHLAAIERSARRRLRARQGSAG